MVCHEWECSVFLQPLCVNSFSKPLLLAHLYITNDITMPYENINKQRNIQRLNSLTFFLSLLVSDTIIHSWTVLKLHSWNFTAIIFFFSHLSHSLRKRLKRIVIRDAKGEVSSVSCDYVELTSTSIRDSQSKELNSWSRLSQLFSFRF